MRTGSVWLGLAAMVLLGLTLCGGMWSPLALLGVATGWVVQAKLGLWVLVWLAALCGGPVLLGWAFLRGPPDPKDGTQLAGTAVLVLAGLALTAVALARLPAMWAVFLAWSVLPWA